jgi:hypothetical protein
MDEREVYKSIMTVLIPKLSELFSADQNISLEEANKYIYNSNLYKELEVEETKLWYYSVSFLNEILKSEHETGVYSLFEQEQGNGYKH